MCYLNEQLIQVDTRATLMNCHLPDLKIEAEKKSADGWEYFSGKWYYFSTYKKTWTASKDACVTKGGDLVIIESEKEQVEYYSQS